jgi:hypothetical protein
VLSDWGVTICADDAEFHEALEKIPEHLIESTHFIEGTLGSCWLIFHRRLDL